MGTLLDLTGKKFGRMTALYRYGTSHQGLATWLCVCDCGKEKIVIGRDLTRGHTKSCRCLHIDRISKPKGVAASNELFLMYKQDARKRNHAFNIPRDEFDKLITSNCYYCGQPPYQVFRKPNDRKYRRDSIVHCGIDRYDNSIGYELDNVVSCCWNCNRAKNSLNGDEFIEMVIRIADRWKLRIANGKP